MSHSFYAAPRKTHAKVVVVGLLCAMIVVMVGLSAKVGDTTGARESIRLEAEAGTVRIGGPNAVTSNEQNTIR